MVNNKIIYLDNAATTKVNEEVLKSYIEVSTNYFANASSIHGLGVKSSDLLAKARNQILKCLKCHDHDVIFTSGATESNNLAIKGYALQYQNRGKHIITTRIEHPSVLETLRQLENLYGFEVSYLPVNEKGIVSINDIKSAIRKDTILISVMAVNNEVGAINPISDIAKLIKNYPKIALHVDAVQALGKIAINYDEIDMITFTGHKINSLKGSGALLIKKRITLVPNNAGGGQESGLRSGTSDLAGAVALSKAIRIATENKEAHFNHVRNIIAPLLDYLKSNNDLYEINSNNELNPFIINFSLKNKKAAVVVEALSNEGIMVSSISACHSKGEKASYVVKEMSKDDLLAHNTIRISPNFDNTNEDIETLIKKLKVIIGGIRN
jgi:cysteine desulfurase